MEDLDLGATIKGFTPGQKVFKRYTLKKILGRGGMGVVWLAHDEKLDEAVALKFLPDAVKLDASALDDLKRETKRARQLTHPGIVRIHDFLEDAAMAAIAMEAVDGTTFSQLRIERPSRVFEVADIAGWVRQLCAALDYAHTDARVVHRDLKPANIMVDQRGRVKITDFGISQSISDSISRVSAQRASSGTPAYMSPQQMLGGKSSPADDIYSLGATIYELLTGRPPFYAGNLIAQVQSVTPAPLAARRQDLEVTGAPIPAAWEQLVAACLAKDPAGRPRSAADMLSRLGGAGAPTDTPVPADPDVELPVAQPTGGIHAVNLPGGGKLELMPVPAGEFILGSPDAEAGRYAEEGPRTHVTISRPFWLGRTPVSHGQWRAVMGTGLREQVIQALQDDKEYQVDGKTQTLRAQWGMERDADPQRMFGSTSDDVAMYFVSWSDAREFCRRLTELERAAGRLPEGHVFELPTEAQWEYACRAGTRTATPAGPLEIRGQMNAPILDAIAWYGGNSSARYTGEGWSTAEWKEKQYPGGNAGPRNVGLKRPNAWGLHDMLGNVWEWCADLYTAYPGGSCTDPVGRGAFASRVFRGGAWNAAARDTRAANRNWGPATARRSAYGLRVALVPAFEVPVVPGSTQPQGAPDDARYPDQITPGEPWCVSLPGGVDLPLRWAPPGEFTLGSPEGEPGAYDEEGPRTQVRLTRGFWLGRTSVTQAQWRAVTGVSLREQMKRFLEDTRRFKLGDKLQTLREFWEIPPGTDPATRIGEESGTLPMYYVNWTDAMRFCTQLTALERAAGRLPAGYEYVLPTEAQWEYACRASTTDATYGGPIEILGEHNAPVLDPIAWYGGNSSVGFTGSGWDTEKWADKQFPGGNAGARVVATRAPNAWGLFDMLGNVLEWCFDGYEKYPGGTVTDRVANPAGLSRLMRGGGWRSKARDCRAANRNWDFRYTPGLSIGFRVALAPVIADKPPADDVAAATSSAVSEPHVFVPPARRERLVLGFAVALILLVALGVMFWSKRGKEEAPPDDRSREKDQSVVPAPPAPKTMAEAFALPEVSVATLVAPGAVATAAMSATDDGAEVYFTGAQADGQQAIFRVHALLGAVSKLYSAFNPNGLTVSGDSLYWIDPNSGPLTDTQIWQASKDGQGKPAAIYTGSAEGETILDGSGLVMSDTGVLWAVDQVGGQVTGLTFIGVGAGRAQASVLVPARYGGGFSTEHFQSITRDGLGGFLLVGSGKDGVVAPGILHHRFAEGDKGDFEQFELGSGSPLVSPRAVACDGQVVFVADPGADNAIWCVPLDGGSLIRLPVPAGTFQRIGGLAYTTTNDLVVTDAGNGAVIRLGNLPTRGQLLFGRAADESGMEFTESGLGYHMLETGTGDAPVDGATVKFSYSARDAAGRVISESAPEYPVALALDGQLAEGMAEGLKLMQPGGRARFLIAPALGSGLFYPLPRPDKPGGVIVEVTLLEVRPAN